MISADIYAFIDEKLLADIIDKNKGLKNYLEQEIDRMSDEGLIKKCGTGCGGCHSGDRHQDSMCGGCHSGDRHRSAYLTTALISIFNYYIPDDIKDAINMGGSTFIEESD